MEEQKAMRYCVIDLVHLGEDKGWAPDFPPEVDGFGLVAEPGSKSRWGLYEYTREEGSDWSPAFPVEGDLLALLDSAKKFPPAMALSRVSLNRLYSGLVEPSKTEFLSALSEALTRELQTVSKCRYIMAPAIVDEFGYLTSGEWYWVLGFSRDRRSLHWVSDDFFIDTNPIAHFDLTDGRAEHLRRQDYTETRG